jgi:iron complex transport system substrate-binding protein
LKIPEIFKISAKWRKKIFGVILIAVASHLFYIPDESLGADKAPVMVTDDLGESVMFDGRVRRVVSLYIGHTENLIAIGARDSIVGIGHGTEDLGLTVPTLGQRPGIEQIIALGSDLVLTRPMMARAQEPLYRALRSMGIRVLAFDPPAWDEFPEYIGTLRSITAQVDEHEDFAEGFAALSGDVTSGRKMRALLITNGRSMMTCTADSWAAHIMEAAGLVNVAGDALPVQEGSVIAAFGPERILASGGEIDVILLQQGAMNTTSAEDFMNDPRFSSLRAVRTGMVFDVSEADISRPSLLRLKRGSVKSLRDLVYSREAVSYGRYE